MEDVILGEGVAWIRLFWLALHLWHERCIVKIISMFRTLIDIDEDTRKFNKVDNTKILV